MSFYRYTFEQLHALPESQEIIGDLLMGADDHQLSQLDGLEELVAASIVTEGQLTSMPFSTFHLPEFVRAGTRLDARMAVLPRSAEDHGFFLGATATLPRNPEDRTGKQVRVNGKQVYFEKLPVARTAKGVLAVCGIESCDVLNPQPSLMRLTVTV
jgi:hypothetical protein